MEINILLFDGFETLDAFGPVEILARIEGGQLHYLSQHGGIVTSAQGVQVHTEPAAAADQSGILVLPGGPGTRTLVNDPAFLPLLKSWADHAQFCLSVCTGSALLGKCGALDGKRATSNKAAMEWVRSTGSRVDWVPAARWVADGKFYTSSGVSAGMDMALGFIGDQFGREKASAIAHRMEYIWNDDCTKDPFAT